MFEAKIQTYWGDADPAGMVFFPKFFEFIERAEEELFRARGPERQTVMDGHQVWFPRVEAFAKYVTPIQVGEAILVRLKPQFKGTKTVRYDFEILGAADLAVRANGYVVMVCVDRESFKSQPIPEDIRKMIEKFA